MIARDQLVKIAREAVSGSSRVLEDGSVEHKLPAVQCPEKFEPNEWVIEAMRVAYRTGHHAGYDAAKEVAEIDGAIF